MTKTIFIGATGTDIGKTYVTCLLLHQLTKQGYKALAIKPVISGFDENAVDQSDSGQILDAMGRPPTLDEARLISPWRYKEPLPPHFAAAQTGQSIDFDQLVEFCKSQCHPDIDFLLIEGVGGIMVPLTTERTTLDLVERLDCSCLIVTGSYLGTLSHTLTTLACIKHKRIKLNGVIVSESPQSYADFDLVFDDFTKMLPNISLRKLKRNDREENIASLLC